MPPPLRGKDGEELASLLRARVESVDVERIAARIATTTSLDPADADATLRTYLNESYVAMRLVGPHLSRATRILEIGSGIGFFAAFLAEQGFDVVELEPVGQGFEVIGAARQALGETIGGPRHLDLAVEGLRPDQHGRFDLVYSLNVLEHLPDWRAALTTMRAVLDPGGVMVHSCPNYWVPYEPHFGVPLLPVLPRLTARLLPLRISSSDMWRSLNWIDYGSVRRWSREAEMVTEFARGQVADAFDRLKLDPEFSGRHAGPVAKIGGFLARTGVTRLLRHVPPGANSPMEFTSRAAPRVGAP